jgi:hypothetical protein
MPSLASGQPREITITTVHLETDGSVQVSYCLPQVDLKVNGVVHMHSVLIPSGANYEDELTNFRDALVYMVRDVLEDLETLEAMPQPPTQEDR